MADWICKTYKFNKRTKSVKLPPRFIILFRKEAGDEVILQLLVPKECPGGEMHADGTVQGF